MIDAIISGRLISKPQRHADKTGKPFAVGRVRAQMGTTETTIVNVVCFATTAARMLLALGEGDSIAVTGSLTVKTFAAHHGTWKPSLDLVGHALLVTYHAQARREAMAEPPETEPCICAVITAELSP